jgi:hypothetical protein
MARGEAVIKLAGFEYPQGKIPETFDDLLDFGRKSWLVECFGYQWEYATIDEWEGREVTKRGANLDDYTRGRLMKIDFLTQSVIRAKCLKADKTFEFEKEVDKVLLRTILLSCDPKVINVLWDGYMLGARMADKEFEDNIKDIRQRIAEGFFVLAGESSKLAEGSPEAEEETPPSGT